MSEPIINQPWEDVADDVTGAIEKAVQPLLKAAVDNIYAGLLDATQDYLKDNLAFNIASRIDCAERQAYSDRMELANVMRERDDLYIALLGLKPIMDTAESNASGGPEWPYVSKRIKAAWDAIDKATAK